MDFEQLHRSELLWIRVLQSIRGPLLDQIMTVFDVFDSMPFYYLVIVALWYGYNRKLGLQILYLFLISLLLNQNLKNFLSQPRPLVLDPSLGLLPASSFGFPSGAGQAYMALYLYLGFTLRKKWVWIVGALVVLAVSYSRIYLGLHFPSDIAGGWIFGSAIAIFCHIFFPKLERLLYKRSKKQLTELSLLIAILLSFCSVSFEVRLGVLAALGATLGVLWSPFLLPAKHVHQRIIRLFIAITGSLLILKLGMTIKKWAAGITGYWIYGICLFALGLWIGAGVSLLCEKIAGKAHRK